MLWSDNRVDVVWYTVLYITIDALIVAPRNAQDAASLVRTDCNDGDVVLKCHKFTAIDLSNCRNEIFTSYI
jgi:hypothetical protein